jgi:hypothetical protein
LPRRPPVIPQICMAFPVNLLQKTVLLLRCLLK